MASQLGAPEQLINKAPTADLESLDPGKTDEDALGLSYDQIDDFLEGKKVESAAEQRIIEIFESTQHKRQAMIASLGLKAITKKKTITDPRKLREAVEKIRNDQISIDNEEYIDGIIAIAVPITDNQGRFYNSVALQAPVFRMPLESAREHIPLLREAAKQLSILSNE